MFRAEANAAAKMDTNTSVNLACGRPNRGRDRCRVEIRASENKASKQRSRGADKLLKVGVHDLLANALARASGVPSICNDAIIR